MGRKNSDEMLVTKVNHRLNVLKKQTDIFFNKYEEIDIDLKNLLKCIVDNLYKLFERISKGDEDIIETFNFDIVQPMLQQIHIYNKYHIRNEKPSFSYDLNKGDMILINLYLNYNAKVLKMELENSLTDGRYRYPRCLHLNKPVKHELYVYAKVYSKETKDSSLLFLICEECDIFLENCFIKYNWMGENEWFCTLGYMVCNPLYISLY